VVGLAVPLRDWALSPRALRMLLLSVKDKGTSVVVPLNPNTWYDTNTHFTNDVQMQLGVSIFLPTSFEYRLPK